MTADMLSIIAPGLTVTGGEKDELVWAETLAYQAASAGYLFALVRLQSGRYAAVWQHHATVGTLEELTTWDTELAVLNRHERSLVRPPAA